jgi:hypothetical protein
MTWGDRSYEELLADENWKEKRRSILVRDAHKCTRCGYTPSYDEEDFSIRVAYVPDISDAFDTLSGPGIAFANPAPLHVHHRYYVLGRSPWEYDDDALISLCPDCHADIHQTESVVVYSSDRQRKIPTNPCVRCRGLGHLPQYRHVQGGVCFRCWGAGCEEVLDDPSWIDRAHIFSEIPDVAGSMAMEADTSYAQTHSRAMSRFRGYNGLFVSEVSQARTLHRETGSSRRYWKLTTVRRIRGRCFFAVRFFWYDEGMAPQPSVLEDMRDQNTNLLELGWRSETFDIKARPYILEGCDSPVMRRDGTPVMQERVALILLPGESVDSALTATYRDVSTIPHISTH